MGHYITKIHFYLGEDQEALVIELEETHAQDQKNVAEGKNFLLNTYLINCRKNKFYISNFF